MDKSYFQNISVSIDAITMDQWYPIVPLRITLTKNTQESRNQEDGKKHFAISNSQQHDFSSDCKPTSYPRIEKTMFKEYVMF